jgi:hypothetical protein
LEEYKRWQILVSSQALSKVLGLNIVRLYKRKAQIIILESRNNLGETVGRFCQKAFGSPKSVVEYLGRYTHKIAISNHRIQSVNDQNVTFGYKDYRVNGQKKSMSLTTANSYGGFPCIY